MVPMTRKPTSPETTPVLTGEIALAHFGKLSDYYTRLSERQPHPHAARRAGVTDVVIFGIGVAAQPLWLT
jgi:hypothetical protein